MEGGGGGGGCRVGAEKGGGKSCDGDEEGNCNRRR